MSETDAYAALRNPIVRRFAGGRFGAVLGLQMLSVSVGWHLYERTASAWALGLVGAIELAAGLPADADHRHRRRSLSAAAAWRRWPTSAWPSPASGLAAVTWRGRRWG